MATATSYREIVKEVVLQYAALRPSHGHIRLDALLDEKQDRYALVQVGWDRGRRVRGLLLYITLVGDKVYIEYDGMEHSIVDDLVRHGLAEDQIVLTYVAESPV